MFGTNILQIAFMSAYVNKIYHDYINEERLVKLMDALVPKSTVFYIAYRNEDFEFFKTIDPTIVTSEDIIKTDDNQYVSSFYYF